MLHHRPLPRRVQAGTPLFQPGFNLLSGRVGDDGYREGLFRKVGLYFSVSLSLSGSGSVSLSRSLTLSHEEDGRALRRPLRPASDPLRRPVPNGAAERGGNTSNKLARHLAENSSRQGQDLALSGLLTPGLLDSGMRYDPVWVKHPQS